MSNYPWDILGITPTRDELEIRRAYARMLRKSRPDEDPEGFARLVAAREFALKLLAMGHVVEAPANRAEANASSGQPEPEQSETEASQSFSSKDFEAAALGENEAEATKPPEQSEADASQGFSSRDFVETVVVPRNEAERTKPPEQSEAEASHRFSSRDFAETVVVPRNEAERTKPSEQSETRSFSSRDFSETVTLPRTGDFDAQATAFAAVMARLRELVHGIDGNNPGPIWEPAKWRAALGRISELALQQRHSLREFIVREALPLLPSLQSAGATKVREGQRPGLVVVIWEDEFSIAQDQSKLTRLCGSPAMLNYLAWLDHERRLATAQSEANRVRAQALAFTELMNRLQKLVRGVNNAGPTWDADKWRANLTAVSELSFAQRQTLREFIVKEALPLLPKLQSVSEAANDMREGRGPCPVVAIWEDEFSITQDHSTLARISGSPAMLRYLDWLTLAVRTCPLDKRTEAERHFLNCLNKLLPPRNATASSNETSSNEAWALARWELLFALVRRMEPAEVARCRDLFAERLTAWLPDIPEGPLAKLGTETAPATIVEEIEREFTLTERFDAPSVDDAGVSRYQDWLVYARHMRSVTRRSAQGASAYRDAAGIPVIPSEDMALGVLPDKIAQAALAQAQRDGRWRQKFDPAACYWPSMSLARSGFPFAGAGLLAAEVAAFFSLRPFPAVPRQAAILAAVLLAVHLMLAFAIQRLTVVAAVRRVKRADQQGLVNPRERRRAIASVEPPAWVLLPIGIPASLLPIIVVAAWMGAMSYAKRTHAERLRHPAETAEQWTQPRERACFLPEVVKAVVKGVEIDLKSEPYYRQSGETFLNAGNWRCTVEAFTHVIELNPDDAEAHLKRALAYASSGRNDLAAPDYAAVMQLNPDGAKQRILIVWQQVVSIYLKKNLRYPAGRDKQDAQVTVQFSMDRNGHLLSKSVEESSGDAAFDTEALSMLERSDPLPPPPPPVTNAEQEWKFRMPILFRTKSKRGGPQQ